MKDGKKTPAKRVGKALGIPILFADIRSMIEEARAAVAITVNQNLTMLHWRIGRRIREEILQGGRAEYGEEILATLSQELTRDPIPR